MKKIVVIILICAGISAKAQKNTEITPENYLKLQQYEDTLQFLGDSAVQSKYWDIREVASVQFLKRLAHALHIENSYNYPFDSLKTVSIINSEDNKFRIITWQLTMKDQSYRYYGTIQMNNSELKMFPMIDMSMFIGNEQDTVLGPNSWYGCLYYNIVKQRYKKQDYYLLFGWDGYDKWSNKKLVDVLTFDEFGTPVFGAPIFELKDDPKPKTRIIIEYKEDASPTLNYDDNLKMIVISYMRPENPLSEGIYFTYIPDGTYVGFYFKKGIWHYKEKVFDQTQDAPPDNTPKREGVDPNIYKKQ